MRRRDPAIRVTDMIPIVADAAIAGPVLEGVSVPLLILDTTEHPTIAEIIRVSKFFPPGDIVSTWGGLKGQPYTVLLVLDFLRPIAAAAVLSFEIGRQGILVDGVLTARAVYLQAGKPGDRLIHDPDKPKLLVEIAATEFRKKWDGLFLKGLTAAIRKEQGVSKKLARTSAELAIEELRSITGFRMPRS
ncbi:MAG TPA: hypothetical protein DGG94_04300 [Micromonosporaceae bacterium]|nr:hypothetical protein [Micromonosporaceae bacterium]HCU49020.1 hypothetical protein [Micromonosporaceae bacterium]